MMVARSQNPAATQPASPEICWTELVEKIRQNNEKGMEDLYRVFSRGVRFYLCRHLGPQDLDDRVHETFLIVAQAIQRGDLREPERLMGYVRTVVRRQVAAQIEDNVQSRRHHIDLEWGLAVHDAASNPEQAAIRLQKSGDRQEGIEKHCAARSRNSGALLHPGTIRGTDLRRNGSHGNPVSTAEIAREGAVW